MYNLEKWQIELLLQWIKELIPSWKTISFYVVLIFLLILFNLLWTP